MRTACQPEVQRKAIPCLAEQPSLDRVPHACPLTRVSEERHRQAVSHDCGVLCIAIPTSCDLGAFGENAGYWKFISGRAGAGILSVSLLLVNAMRGVKIERLRLAAILLPALANCNRTEGVM